MNPMASFLQIFYDPAAVFAKVRERGYWAAPLIATVLLTMLFGYYVTRTIGMENITRRVFEEHPALARQMPPDKLEQAIQQSASPARVIMGSFFGGLTVIVIELIFATILMVMLSIMDRKLQFSNVFGTVAWSTFPFTVITCIMGVLILFISRDPSELNPQTLVATSVGVFLDKNSMGPFVYSIAGSIDVLAIGKLLLLSFGVSKVAGLGFGKALSLLLTLWLVWILLRAGVAAATGF
jgi:hypothetical protein